MWHLVPRHQLSLPATIHKTCVSHQRNASTWLHWEGCLWTLFTEEAPSTKMCPHHSVVETAQEYIMVKVRLVWNVCYLEEKKQRQYWKQAIREISAYQKTLQIWRTLTLVAPEETQRSLTFSQLTPTPLTPDHDFLFQAIAHHVCCHLRRQMNTPVSEFRKQLAPECTESFSWSSL